jgi:hypothetical protein
VVEPTRTPDHYGVHTVDGRAFDETDAASALRLVFAELPG